ncbi:YrrC family ATP-dependent DNA helicase [Paracraurococcus lichenis]
MPGKAPRTALALPVRRAGCAGGGAGGAGGAGHLPQRGGGFYVLRVKARGQRDLITVIGHAASIAAGEWITAMGEWGMDRTHRPAVPRPPLRRGSSATSPPA